MGNPGSDRVGSDVETEVNTRIAEFEDADDALRFARMKGPDYCVCGGIRFMYAVRPKSAREVGGTGEQPPDRLVDEDEFYEDDDNER